MAGLYHMSNSVRDINAEGPNSDDDNELSHNLSWYRFGPSAITVKPTSAILDFSVIKDFSSYRGISEARGKDYIESEPLYLGNWVPTLLLACVLQKANAQRLIERSEEKCEA
jgi:hypothetical protein